ncbi:hypothetical protein HCN44_009793 [Aphidius gifuensis]|uniref:Ig-like domain-containing protein n=2 Tax=Aphidius gifuensis TaxID=684658 RepID=A0A834Y590_APHGI|nr:hypothetical protein HCN44_009793 [Aphidius gifuensis]
MVASNQFQRVGACGFRGLADDFKNVGWEIVEETKLSHKYSGTFIVRIQSPSEITQIHFYKDNKREPSVIPLDIYNKLYCKILMPNNEYVKNDKNNKDVMFTNSEYVINKENEYSGKWIVEYQVSGEKDIKQKIYDVTFEDKIIPTMKVSTKKNSINDSVIEFQCSINFKRITQCSFEGPSGLIINEGIADKSDRFDFEVSDKRNYPTIQNPACTLTIHNLRADEQGQWQCSLRDETQTANGTKKIEQPKTLTVEIFQKIGTEFNVNCTDNNEWEECHIVLPNGETVENTLPDSNNNDGKCTTKIKSADESWNGNLTCNIGHQKGEINYKKTFIVRVTEDFALADFKYEINDGNNQAVLEARPFPTDENKMKNITECRWTHPVDSNYLSYDSYYTMTNDNNVCRLVIKYPQEYDKGSWSCIITLKSSNGAWDKFISFVNVKELEIYSMLWWYILYGLIVALIIIAIIIFVWWDLVFQSKTAVLNKDKTQQEKQFKYIYGKLNRTKKPSSNENESPI